MTVFDLAAAFRRCWWLVVLGLLATTCVGFVVRYAPGVYHQQVDVVFMYPSGRETDGNFLQYGNQSLIKTAGVVAKVVSENHDREQVVSDTATIVGKGARHGYSVRLPNAGGQWAYNFERPVLNVETVGETAEEVQRTTAGVLVKIDRALVDLQRDEGVPRDMMIRTRVSPPVLTVDYSTGSRTRAVGATGLLGLGLTVALVIAVDRRRGGAKPRGAGDRPGRDDLVLAR